MPPAVQLTPVVLAGGSGTRLWPLSSAEAPKQFVLKTAGGHSLFQETLLRVADRARFRPPLLVCNRRHRALVAAHLAAIGCGDADIIFEAAARNTAPAITLAALHLAAHTPGALMLVVPSDHRIAHPQAWLRAVEAAMPAARAGSLVTFAVAPTAAEPGYGYIELGAPLAAQPPLRRIARFIEKPPTAVAAEFLRAGGYGWNSGIFLMSAAALLCEMATHAPEIHAACVAATARARRAGDGGRVIFPQAAALAACPAVAFDRAVMEQTAHGAVVEVAMGWRDLGSWAALAAEPQVQSA